MSLIDIDYQDTLRKADQLERLAEELRQVSAHDLQDLQSGVGRTWRGSSAELYRKRMQTLQRQVDAQARDLKSTASRLRQAAEHYRRLELMANSIFGL